MEAVGYRRIKNPEAALEELNNALEITPEFPLALLEKAEVLFELYKADEGMMYYENYLKMIPSDWYATPPAWIFIVFQ